jgi:hypothetical protein
VGEGRENVTKSPRQRSVSGFTFRLCRLVVGLAHELPVLHEIELVAGVELARTQRAGEALQVVNVVLSSPHDLRRWNAQIT